MTARPHRPQVVARWPLDRKRSMTLGTRCPVEVSFEPKRPGIPFSEVPRVRPTSSDLAPPSDAISNRREP